MFLKLSILYWKMRKSLRTLRNRNLVLTSSTHKILLETSFVNSMKSSVIGIEFKMKPFIY